MIRTRNPSPRTTYAPPTRPTQPPPTDHPRTTHATHAPAILSLPTPCAVHGFGWSDPVALARQGDLHSVGFYVGGGNHGASHPAVPPSGRLGALRFVRVRHVTAASLLNPCDASLLVSFDRSQLPHHILARENGELLPREVPLISGRRALTMPGVVLCRTPPLSRFGRGWRLGLAWVLNMVALCATYVLCLLATSSSEQSDSEDLKASSMSLDDWRAAVTFGIVLSCVESFLLIDGLKVIVLTLTSTRALDAVLPPHTTKRRLARKPLRRLHMVVDAVL